MQPSRVLCTHPRPNAELRLLCIPSAGSGASMYREWGAQLRSSIEVIGVHLPGREALMAEPLQGSITSMAEYVRETVVPLLDRPYAIFGHSMGAWIAFELLRDLLREGHSMPLHFFASSRPAPHLVNDRPAIHMLDDDELVSRVTELFGGIPAAVLAEPELLELLLPILRADLKAVETYRYRDSEPLACPISAFGGTLDREIGRQHIEGWRRQTTGPFNLRQFHGDHFYLNGAAFAELCDEIDITLRKAMPATS